MTSFTPENEKRMLAEKRDRNRVIREPCSCFVMIVHQVFWIEMKESSIIFPWQRSCEALETLLVLERPRELLDVCRARSWICGCDGYGTWR